MKLNKKYLLSSAIVGFTALAIFFISSNPPHAKRGRPSQATQLMVEAQTIKAQHYQIVVESFGTVKPKTQSSLVAQVSGQVLYISPNFREGGVFKQGELLVKLDDRDYQADVKIAQATVFSAQQVLAEEQAKSQQALTDWQRLGNGETPTDLVLRKPQLAAAQASVMSAQAQLEMKEIALERSQIVAPFDGRVLTKQVDLGQVVSNNTQLASIYAVDYVEIRLPINNNDLALMTLPESYQATKAIEVAFSSTLVGEQHWQGSVIRSEAAIDDNSQQLYVVAQINKPFDVSDQQPVPIKIGQYLTASIVGKKLPDAIVVPNNTIYQGSYVYLIQEDKLRRQAVEILWQNNTEAVIKSGIKIGDKLITTSLGQVSSGTSVAIVGEGKPDNAKLKMRMSKRKTQSEANTKPRLEKSAKDKGAQS